MLRKVKQLKNGGLFLEYRLKGAAGGDQYISDITLKDPREPHPDLTCLIDKLDTLLAKSVGFGDILTVKEGVDIQMTKAQNLVIDRVFAHLLSLIEVTGIAISGDEGKQGAVITGTMLCKNGGVVALNSPHIKTALDKFGFEEELQEIIDDLHREVYLFLYEHKAAQLDLFNEAAEADKIKELAAV